MKNHPLLLPICLTEAQLNITTQTLWNTKAYCVHLYSFKCCIHQVQLHGIKIMDIHILECAGGEKNNNEGRCCECLLSVSITMKLPHHETPTSHCALMTLGYLSLNGESLQTIPMNLLVRIGLRLTHSFVWSGDTLKAQRDFSVKLRITIQWCFCFAVCASLPCRTSLERVLN